MLRGLSVSAASNTSRTLDLSFHSGTAASLQGEASTLHVNGVRPQGQRHGSDAGERASWPCSGPWDEDFAGTVPGSAIARQIVCLVPGVMVIGSFRHATQDGDRILVADAGMPS
jgi:hypothetical protein